VTDRPPTAEVHLEHVLDGAAVTAVPLDTAKSLFATAVADVSVRSHVLGQEVGRRQAAEEMVEYLRSRAIRADMVGGGAYVVYLSDAERAATLLTPLEGHDV
jgi:hypothetical protein